MFISLEHVFIVFFFNDTATTEIYTYGHTLALHDALPISAEVRRDLRREYLGGAQRAVVLRHEGIVGIVRGGAGGEAGAELAEHGVEVDVAGHGHSSSSVAGGVGRMIGAPTRCINFTK